MTHLVLIWYDLYICYAHKYFLQREKVVEISSNVSIKVSRVNLVNDETLQHLCEPLHNPPEVTEGHRQFWGMSDLSTN